MLGRVYDGRMVDVWSTGCSLFVMLAGAFPFLQVRLLRSGIIWHSAVSTCQSGLKPLWKLSDG